MNRFFSLILFFTFSFFNLSNAQDLSPKNGLIVGANLINHDFPLTNSLNNTNIYTAAFEIGYARKIHPHFNLLTPIQIGKATYPTADNRLGDSELFSSLDLLGQILFTKRNYIFSPYAVLGPGIEAKFEQDDRKIGISFPVGLGVDVNIRPNLAIGLRSEYRFGLDENPDNLQFNLGLTTFFNTGKKEKERFDSDSDGVDDDKDECPNEPGSPTANGCPDKDGDGVADSKDACPELAGLAAHNGCPFSDSDGDGVQDSEDKCPYEKGLPALGGCPDSDGDGVADAEDRCPDIAGSAGGCPDQDGDGVADVDDRCPNQAGSAGGCPDQDGDGVADADDPCPEFAGPASASGCPDSDGDGVPDHLDKCPNEAGDSTGCPPLEKEEIDFLAEAPQKVEFEFGNAVLTAASSGALDKIVAILKNHPAHHLKIGGHTDSIGSEVENQKLSEKRAKSCFNFLVKKGISKDRISYKGFGEKVPIATNMYKDGRQKNRRVEFDIFLPE